MASTDPAGGGGSASRCTRAAVLEPGPFYAGFFMPAHTTR